MRECEITIGYNPRTYFFFFSDNNMPTFFSYPDIELQQKLKKTAEAIVAPGKGILAVDESNGKRLF